jgi:tetratricopeptide (TPR) repeat protein
MEEFLFLQDCLEKAGISMDDLKKDPNTYLETMADFYYYSRLDVEKAIALYKKLPKNDTIHLKLVRALLVLGKKEVALSLLRKIKLSLPLDLEPYRQYALDHAANLERCMILFHKKLNTFEIKDEEYYETLWFCMNVFQLGGYYEEALDMCNELIAYRKKRKVMNPESIIDLLDDKFEFLLRLGRSNEAVKIFEEILTTCPEEEIELYLERIDILEDEIDDNTFNMYVVAMLNDLRYQYDIVQQTLADPKYKQRLLLLPEYQQNRLRDYIRGRPTSMQLRASKQGMRRFLNRSLTQQSSRQQLVRAIQQRKRQRIKRLRATVPSQRDIQESTVNDIYELENDVLIRNYLRKPFHIVIGVLQPNGKNYRYYGFDINSMDEVDDEDIFIVFPMEIRITMYKDTIVEALKKEMNVLLVEKAPDQDVYDLIIAKKIGGGLLWQQSSSLNKLFGQQQ